MHTCCVQAVRLLLVFGKLPWLLYERHEPWRGREELFAYGFAREGLIVHRLGQRLIKAGREANEE
jgi:hypothetical protein